MAQLDRPDTDGCFIGEIMGVAISDAAAQAHCANLGPKFITSQHTNDIVAAITRFLNNGARAYQLKERKYKSWE